MNPLVRVQTSSRDSWEVVIGESVDLAIRF